MTRLDANSVRNAIGEDPRVDAFEVFPEIDSTNSYLMQQPGPPPGCFHIALTDNQTAGRGRRGRTWLSPPGSGLCLSMAYTFPTSPPHLPALTLAIGLGVIEALDALDVKGVQLKWPNDLVADDGKLGGILTEAQAGAAGAMTVVTGVGINVRLEASLDLGDEAEGALRPVDLTTYAGHAPPADRLAATLVERLQHTFVTYDASGFSAFVDRWSKHDWLFGRELTVDTAQRRVTGIGAGIADDGALLLASDSAGTSRVTSGTVVAAGGRGR